MMLVALPSGGGAATRRPTLLLAATMTVMILLPLVACARGDQQKAVGGDRSGQQKHELDEIQNGKIAFDHHAVNTEAGSVPEEDIWTVNPDGSNRAQLTTNSRD